MLQTATPAETLPPWPQGLTRVPYWAFQREDVYGGKIVFHGKVLGLGAGSGNAFALLPPQNATGNWIKIVQRVPVRILLDPKELEVVHQLVRRDAIAFLGTWRTYTGKDVAVGFYRSNRGVAHGLNHRSRILGGTTEGEQGCYGADTF